MISVAQAVEGIVKHKPYLSESLAAGIINISALARQIQKEVENFLGKPVNAGAIGTLFTSARTGAIKQITE